MEVLIKCERHAHCLASLSFGFTLKPKGFFAENPAMDLPADRNDASCDSRDGSCYR
jgi:hypothetical protein